MGKPCISNRFYFVTILFAICCYGTCKDQSLESKDHFLGRAQSETSSYTRNENYDKSYGTTTSSFESSKITASVKNSQDLSVSKVYPLNVPSSVSSDNAERLFTSTGHVIRDSSVASDSIHTFSSPTMAINKVNTTHSYGLSISGDSITQSMQSVQPTLPSAVSLTVSSHHSIISLSATSYAVSSYHSVRSKTSVNVTNTISTKKMVLLNSTVSGSSESSQIVSTSQLRITSSTNFVNISIMPTSLPSSNSSLQSPSSTSINLDTSILPVTEKARNMSALVTSSLKSIETLSVLTVTPSSSWSIYPSDLSSVVSNQSDIKPIAKKGCYVVLDGLAQAMGQMTVCLIQYLRPIEVCAKCTKFHSNLRRYENLIYNTKDCEEELVLEYNAQYQAIRKMFNVQYKMWQAFECEKCYKDRIDTDPSAAWVPKEEFLNSQLLIRDIMVCFANYSQSEISLPYPVILNVTKSRNGSSTNPGNMICTECESMYKMLRKYMKSIHFEGSAEKRWCADMVYGFNETRRIWGDSCVKHNKDKESIIALTCFFCFLPVVFYIGTKLHSDVKERKNESRVNYESD